MALGRPTNQAQSRGLLLLIELDVESQIELAAELGVELIQQILTTIEQFTELIAFFRRHRIRGVSQQLVQILIALEQLVTLLVEVKLRQPQIGDLFIQIQGDLRIGQHLALLIENT